MKFEKWLLKQKKRNDPIGDLSTDWIADGRKTPFTLSYLKSKNACDGAIEAYKEAIKEFNIYCST